jgi:hypothetical protein
VNQQERDEMVRDIARRVFAEERAGRHVDDQRLTWAAEVLDQRQLQQQTLKTCEGASA